MLLIYTHNTAQKTGWIVTEDIIAPGGGRYKTVPLNHPEAAKAERVMRAMSDYFMSTSRTERPSLIKAYTEACKRDPGLAEISKFLSKTAVAAERILVK